MSLLTRVREPSFVIAGLDRAIQFGIIERRVGTSAGRK